MSALEFCSQNSQRFEELTTLLNLTPDAFVRTTDAQHQAVAQQFWKRLVDSNCIYLDTYSGWYSVRDECFYSESELTADGKAPTGADVEWVAKEHSYFFRLSAFQDRLLEWYQENPDVIAPETRRNEVLAFCNSGLRDLSISRTSFDWGIPVPGCDEQHVMYVWVDALCNYLSGLGGLDSTNYQQFWPASLHIVGKDILRFHAVYWPALLMAAGLPLPRRIYAHGWWTKEGQKISKSLGNVIDPLQLVEAYGIDATRFFLMAEVPFGNDGNFSDQALILKVNANLANELGNLCQRTLSMVYKNCNKAIPVVCGDDSLFLEQNGVLEDSDRELLDSAYTLEQRCMNEVSKQAIHKYVQCLVKQIWDANKYIDMQEPWVLRKTDMERMKVVLYVLLEILRVTAILYQPVIPDTSQQVLDQLAVPVDQRSFAFVRRDYRLVPGTPIGKPKGIFPRFELPLPPQAADCR